MSEFYCPVCLDSYPIADGCILCSSFNGKGDSRKIHQLCIDCIKGIAKSATEDAPIADGGIGLPCPVEECRNVLHINNFEFYLDSNIYTALIQRFQEEAIIAANMDDLVTCPGCQMRLCVDSNLKFYDCPCGRRQCRNCPRIYDTKHENVSCSKLDELDRQNELEPKLSEIAVRVCHRCNLQFVKEDGCNKMECRCKALQCYLCRQPVEDYSHFCECGWKGTSGKCPTCSKSCPLWGDPEERDRIQMEEVIKAFQDTMKTAPTSSFNLFVKNFEEELNDEQLLQLFEKYGQIISHAVMKYSNGKSKGFGFVVFADSKAAESAIKELDGYVLPISKKKLYVTKAQNKDERQAELKQSVNVRVKNLNDFVTEEELREYFKTFGRIISVKMIYDKNNKSRGFGFVRFVNPEDAETVIQNLNGRAVSISKKLHIEKGRTKDERQPELAQNRSTANNVFIRNLDKSINDTDLEREFQRFGAIISAKVARDGFGSSKGFGFVCFEDPQSATRAIQSMNNQTIRSKRVYVALHQKKEDRMKKTPNQHPTTGLNYINIPRPFGHPQHLMFNPPNRAAVSLQQQYIVRNPGLDTPGPSRYPQPRILNRFTRAAVPLHHQQIAQNPGPSTAGIPEILNHQPKPNTPPREGLSLLQRLSSPNYSMGNFDFLLNNE